MSASSPPSYQSYQRTGPPPGYVSCGYNTRISPHIRSIISEYPESSAREDEPLLGPGTEGTISKSPGMCGRVTTILMLLLVISLQFGYICNMNPSPTINDPKERERIRKEWDLEYTNHRKALEDVHREHEAMRHDWAVEHVKHQNLVEEMQREEDRIRKQWDLESANRQKQMEQERQDVAKEHRQHLALRREMDRERHEWEEERRRWEDERARRRREEKDHERKLIHWGPLKKDEECLRYGVASYRAVLEYTPPGYDHYKACKETPMEIHQRDVYATECHYDGQQMTGIWVVDFDERACKPWWRDTKDHGCTSRGSGIHRYEAHLEGYLEPNEFKAHWDEMCNTTPHTMFGNMYKGPTECAYWPKIGVYGFWDIPDPQCW